jgi:metal-dependent amidase/aminoacylase/carboxypeptidase family protein
MGAKVNVTKRKGYSGKKVNEPLIETLWENYASLGVEMKHWRESVSGMPMASTDFGDVSQRIPAASSNIKITEYGTPGHSRQMAEATMTPEGQEAMIVGAKALAMTLVELLADPERLRSVKEYFDAH